MALGQIILEEHTENVQQTVRYCNGSFLDESVVPKLLYKNMKQNRLPESRPKPDNLIANCTELDKAWYYNQTAGKSHFMRDYASYCAGAGSREYYHSIEYPIGAPLQRAVTPPSPDWVTPLRGKINDAYVNIGADVGEYKQTVSMFQDAGKAVLNGWRHLRGKHRGSRRRKKLSLCHVADAELIYSFGVAPLIGSLYDSYSALKHRIDGPIYFKHVQSASETNEGETIQNGLHQKSAWTVSKFATVYVQYQPGSMITLGNPLSIAWELVPYSFLFDYMIPIGETLMALDALAGVASLMGTVTTREELREEVWYDASAFYPQGEYSEVEVVKSLGLSGNHKREYLTGLPLPPFPKWSPSASYKKLLNSVSLLVGANQRCRSRARVPPRGRGGFGRKR